MRFAFVFAYLPSPEPLFSVLSLLTFSSFSGRRQARNGLSKGVGRTLHCPASLLRIPLISLWPESRIDSPSLPCLSCLLLCSRHARWRSRNSRSQLINSSSSLTRRKIARKTRTTDWSPCRGRHASLVRPTQTRLGGSACEAARRRHLSAGHHHGGECLSIATSLVPLEFPHSSTVLPLGVTHRRSGPFDVTRKCFLGRVYSHTTARTPVPGHAFSAHWHTHGQGKVKKFSWFFLRLRLNIMQFLLLFIQVQLGVQL